MTLVLLTVGAKTDPPKKIDTRYWQRFASLFFVIAIWWGPFGTIIKLPLSPCLNIGKRTKQSIMPTGIYKRFKQKAFWWEEWLLYLLPSDASRFLKYCLVTLWVNKTPIKSMHINFWNSVKSFFLINSPDYFFL